MELYTFSPSLDLNFIHPIIEGSGVTAHLYRVVLLLADVTSTELSCIGPYTYVDPERFVRGGPTLFFFFLSFIW